MSFKQDKIKEALKSRSNDYSAGYNICKKCGSYHFLGTGFSKKVVSSCPLCNANKFSYHDANPFVSKGGVGEIGRGENRGLRRAFYSPKKYYVDENGMHLTFDKLERENKLKKQLKKLMEN